MALIQNSFNRYKTTLKKMTSLTKNIDKCCRIREEFRLLIIPLMQKAVDDNPSDLVSYCARYFEDLLMQREEKTISEGIKKTTVSKDTQDTNVEEPKKLPSNQKVPVQSSSSLPNLTHKNQSFGPPLRETSSWSNPSDSSQKAYRRNIQFDVVDAMTQIGDQPDKNKAFQIRGNNDLNKNEQTMKNEGMKLSCGDEREKEKNEQLVSNGGDRNAMEIVANNVYSSSVPQYSENRDKALCALVNSASKLSSNNRKKWSIHDIVESPPGIRPMSSPTASDTSSSDSDDSANSYERFQDVNDEKIISSKLCNVSTASDSSFGFIPLLNLDAVSQSEESAGDEAQPKDKSEKRTPEKPVSTVEDIECFAHSIFQTLRKTLEKELRAAESELNQKLQRLKTSNNKGPNDYRSPMPPRKKRSVTTFSTCGNFSNSKERDKVSKDKILLIDKKSHSSDSKNNLGPDHHSGLVQKETSMNRNDTSTEATHKSTNSVSTNITYSNQQSTECITKVGTKIETSNSTPKNCLSKNEGFVNPGFSMEDEGNDRAFMKRISFMQQQFENNQRRVADHMNHQRNIRSSSNLSAIRPSIARSTQSYHYNGRPSSYAPPLEPNLRISNIGEGDVHPRNLMLSIGTETDNSRTGEHLPRTAGNVARILPIVETVSQNSSLAFRENGDKNSQSVGMQTPLQGNQTASINKSSKVITKAEEMYSKTTDIGKPMEKNSVHESNLPPKGSSCNNLKEKEIESKKNDSVKSVTKKISNLNPCAPVFSPSTGHVTLARQPSNASESLNSIKRSEREKPIPKDDSKSHKPLLSESDIRIESVAWDCLRSENPPGHENIAHSDTQSGYCDKTPKRSTSCAFKDENASKSRELEPKKNGSFTSGSQTKEMRHSDISVIGKRDTESVRSNSPQIRIKSQTKMAEGDRIPSDKNGAKEKTESKFKLEEPCLNSACGDFVPTENNGDIQLPSENENDNQGTNSDNLLDLSTHPVSGEMVLETLESENKPGEEIELNFACLSESDSSDCYSSDMSEDDFSEENFEE